MAELNIASIGAVFAGGGIGSVLRFVISKCAALWLGAFPYGTLAANLLGSFLAGFAAVLIFQRKSLAAPYSDLLLAGFLGGLTTFSSMILDGYRLMLEGQTGLAGVYILLNLAVGFLLFHLAFSFTRVA